MPIKYKIIEILPIKYKNDRDPTIIFKMHVWNNVLSIVGIQNAATGNDIYLQENHKRSVFPKNHVLFWDM